MALNRQLGWAGTVILALALLPACAGDQGPEPASAPVPEVVAATPPKTMPGGAVAVQYWAEFQPKSGKMALYKIHPGNIIYRNEELLSSASALNYRYGNTATENSTCTPGVDCPADTIHMFTDQTKVSYVENGQCFHNGATSTVAQCQSLGVITTTACAQDKVFCGPVQIVSNYLFGSTQGALPDAILDVGNNLQASPANIIGCMDDTADSFKHGLCATQAPAKVNPATSNFVPAVPASGSLKQCSYCYSNNSKTPGFLKGLTDALRSGTSSTLLNVNTDTVALQLMNGNGFTATLTVYYAQPAFDVPGSQITITDTAGATVANNCVPTTGQTKVKITGGGFGPPGACLSGDPPSSCAQSGTPGTASRTTIAGITSPFAPAAWSDNTITTNAINAGTLYGCGVVLNTPYGTFTSDDNIKLCSNTWRPYTPSGLAGRTHGAGGVLGEFMIEFGGRGTAVNSGTATLQAAGLPRCSNSKPGSAVLSTNISVPSNIGRWGIASAVASTGLFIIGGVNTTGTGCVNGVMRINYAGGTTATLTTRTALPDTDPNTAGVQGLCQATASTLFDSVNGREYIVVAGGTTTRPNPSTVANAPNALSDFTFVYDVAADTWNPVNFGIGRYNATSAAFNDTATPANNKMLVVGGSTDAVGSGAATSSTRVITLANGTPSFGAGPALPAAREIAAMTQRSGVFYVHGGATTADTTAAGTNTLFATPVSLSGFTTLQPSTSVRSGHLLLLSNFDEPVFTDLLRLIAIGGFSGTANLTTAEEYNP